MGGPTGLNSALPIFTHPSSFAHAAVSGAYGVRGTVWRKAVQEGWIDRARAQRAVEHLVAASLFRVDRFGRFDAEGVRAILGLPTEAKQAIQLSAGGSGSRRVPSGRRRKLEASGGATAGGVAQHPRVAELMQELAGGVRGLQNSLGLKPEPVGLDKLIPPEVVQKLNAIASALDQRTDAHRTGQDIERLLIEEGITGLAWSHRGVEGIAPIYFSPPFLETPRGKQQIGLMVAVFPKEDPSASAEVMITWQIRHIANETVLPSSRPTPTTAVVTPHPYTIALLREFSSALVAAQLAEIEGGARLQTISMDHYFPAEITLLLDRIFRAFGNLYPNQLKTGRDVEQALSQAGIKGLHWNHIPNIGSFVVLRLTPTVPGATEQGRLVLAVLSEGHRAPTSIYRSGATSLPGQIMLTIHGELLYQYYSDPDSPYIFRYELPGQVRTNPTGSKNVYRKQAEPWIGIYWQPEPAQVVPEVISERALRIRFFSQLNSLGLDADALERWKMAPPSEELGRKVEKRERQWEGKGLRELMEIADSAYTSVIYDRDTLDQLSTREQRDLVQQKINDHLALLVAIANILRDRGL